MSKIKTLCSCKAGGTGDAAGQGRTEAAPSSRAQTCPSPGRIPSPQGAPDRDRSCRNRKAAQPPGTEGLLQSTPFLRPSGRPAPHSARLPGGHKEQTPKFRSSQASQRSHVPRLGESPPQITHSAHANIHIYTDTLHTQTHMHMQMYILCPLGWAGMWGAETTNYPPPLRMAILGPPLGGNKAILFLLLCLIGSLPLTLTELGVFPNSQVLVFC